MDVVRAVVAHRAHVEVLEDVQRLQQRRALRPDVELVDLDAAVAGAERLLDQRLPLREVVERDQAALFLHAAHELLRDVAAVEAVEKLRAASGPRAVVDDAVERERLARRRARPCGSSPHAWCRGEIAVEWRQVPAFRQTAREQATSSDDDAHGHSMTCSSIIPACANQSCSSPAPAARSDTVSSNGWPAQSARAVVTLDVARLEPSIASKVDREITGSILDNSVLERVLAEFQVELVFHLAALLSTRAEFTPVTAHQVNVEGTLNLLEFAQREAESHGRPVVFMYPSSIAAYGLPDLATKARAGRVTRRRMGAPDDDVRLQQAVLRAARTLLRAALQAACRRAREREGGFSLAFGSRD